MTKHINEERLGYKKTKAGWIPEDWDVKPLKDATTLMTNGFVGTAKTAYTDEENGVTYVQGFNVKPLGFDFTGIKKVSQLFHNQNSKSELKTGDLLTVQTGDIGVTAIVPSDLEGANCHALIITRLDNKIFKPNYYAQFFNSEIGRRQLLKIETGTTMKHINVKDMRKVIVPVPALLEQQKIVKILSKWDTAIQKAEALIEAKQQQKKDLMQQLLAGKKRFPEFIPLNGCQYNQTKLGPIPDDWDVVKGKELFTRKSKKGVDAELLAVTQDQGVIPRDLLDRRVVMPEGETTNYKLIEPGDFVISLRSFQGGIEYSEYRGLVSPAYTVLEYDNSIVNKDYYRYYFKSYIFIERLSSAVIGIRDGKQISYPDFEIQLLPLPSFEEQERIAAVLISSDETIALMNLQLNELKQQKKGLMQQLLTGSIRVKVNKDVNA
ncbi:restriction endonuclease subunit S [Halobacteriota archaeon]